jgi:hypothetical protein
MSIKRAGHIARTGEIRNAYKILIEKSAGKTPLERTRSRWEGSIIMDLREVDWKVWTG